MIAKIDHSVSKTAVAQEVQLYAYVVGQDPLVAANHNSHDEQMILVDEPGRIARAARVGPPTETS